eukprot:4333562-Pyramimonas_sp.AAC.1
MDRIPTETTEGAEQLVFLELVAHGRRSVSYPGPTAAEIPDGALLECSVLLRSQLALADIGKHARSHPAFSLLPALISNPLTTARLRMYIKSARLAEACETEVPSCERSVA